MDARTRELAGRVGGSLRELIRDRLARRPGAHLVEHALDEIELRVPLRLGESELSERQFAERLVTMIDELLDEAIRQAAAFRPGRTYCHRCAGVDCEHGAPGSSREVFVGYAPTGTPRWIDLAQHCLDMQHPEVDLLYADPPALVTVVRGGRELHAELLDAFEDPSYELLGQLAAGFYSLRSRAEDGRGVLALTIQVAAIHASRGRPRIAVNLLGRAPSGEGLETLWEHHAELPWRKSLRWAEGALRTIRLRPRGRRGRGRQANEKLEQRIVGILDGLSRRLEREHRSRSRRTRHAAARHASGERPTRKALDDARGAAGSDLLLDERSGTLVVLGERGRTHFFTLDGQHVSSVRYSRGAIEKKLKAELWQPASGAVAQAFRGKLPG